MERTSEPTTQIKRRDRCAGLPHRPRVLLGKMGLDGHDRGVKLIARALRDSGIHVIYSGLWQTPESLALSARDEDVDVLAVSMMSNSHLILVPKLICALSDVGRPNLTVNVGGIIPQEDVEVLLKSGVNRVFHTGTSMDTLVESVLEATEEYLKPTFSNDRALLSRAISLELQNKPPVDLPQKRPQQVIGFTGSPGAGKSTLVAAIASQAARKNQKTAVLAFDPISPITSGALLGDRLRVDFNTVGENVFYRSIAIGGEDYSHLNEIIHLIGGAGFDKLFIETVGAGQNEVRIREYVDKTVVVVVPGMGDSVQMDKAGILEIADMFVVNKADHAGRDILVKELVDIALGRHIFETVATMGAGIDTLFEGLFIKNN